jgi:hypothetical protein
MTLGARGLASRPAIDPVQVSGEREGNMGPKVGERMVGERKEKERDS